MTSLAGLRHWEPPERRKRPHPGIRVGASSFGRERACQAARRPIAGTEEAAAGVPDEGQAVRLDPVVVPRDT